MIVPMYGIVLDGHIKSALATIRSLGAGGIKVSVGAQRKTAMGLYSKYTSHGFIYPSPYTDQKGFVEAVKSEAIRLGGKPIVYAFSDATFLSLYAHREELQECVTITYPEEKSIDIAFDKAATYSVARISGVPTITTYQPETREEFYRAEVTLQYPAVVKTRRSVTWHNGLGVFGSATFVHSKEELEKTFYNLKEKIGETPLIQPMVFGEEYGVEMLVDRGTVYAQVVHHRIRSLSPTGGASVLKETVDNGDLKKTLVEYAENLVGTLSWIGPIMVEFKVDADTRAVYLMEINGRFWGSLPLSIFAGVDMPMLYFNALSKQEFPEHCVEGREGVVSTHFVGDVLHLLRVLFARDEMRKEVYPTRLSAIHGFLFQPRGVYSDVVSIRDMKPVFMEIIDILLSKLKR